MVLAGSHDVFIGVVKETASQLQSRSLAISSAALVTRKREVCLPRIVKLSNRFHSAKISGFLIDNRMSEM